MRRISLGALLCGVMLDLAAQPAFAETTPIETPLTAQGAVELALAQGPGARELYAELGLSQAEAADARHLPALSLGYASISGGGASQITRSLSLGLADLLLLPARSRMAAATLAVARQRVAARLLELQAGAESAWYSHVAALEAAELGDAGAQAASASAGYARALSAAGNLPPRLLALQLAAESEAHIAAARAHAEVARSRAGLAALVGLSTRAGWSTAAMPEIPALDDIPADIAGDALRTRPDIEAARGEVHNLETALRLTRGWGWLGDLTAGYERESETDGSRLRGPTFGITLPLFTHRSAVLRAKSQLERSRAHLAALELGVQNDIALGLDRLATARDIAEAYRTVLVPNREAVAQGTLQQVNFMLTGAFELVQATREQLAAKEEYVFAVRDYWLARVELQRVSGGLRGEKP